MQRGPVAWNAFTLATLAPAKAGGASETCRLWCTAWPQYAEPPASIRCSMVFYNEMQKEDCRCLSQTIFIISVLGESEWKIDPTWWRGNAWSCACEAVQCCVDSRWELRGAWQVSTSSMAQDCTVHISSSLHSNGVLELLATLIQTFLLIIFMWETVRLPVFNYCIYIYIHNLYTQSKHFDH